MKGSSEITEKDRPGVGYYFGASFVTEAGERWFRSQANPWLFDKFELGVYP